VLRSSASVGSPCLHSEQLTNLVLGHPDVDECLRLRVADDVKIALLPKDGRPLILQRFTSGAISEWRDSWLRVTPTFAPGLRSEGSLTANSSRMVQLPGMRRWDSAT
jgi:hypothetical protein